MLKLVERSRIATMLSSGTLRRMFARLVSRILTNYKDDWNLVSWDISMACALCVWSTKLLGPHELGCLEGGNGSVV